LSESVTPIDFSDAMRERFIRYATHVVMDRAVPDLRDGLKPSQRRILWAMWEMGIRHNKPTKKCARVTGNCMGKYHPHGDQALYGALVRMAQPWSLNHPLLEGQGNFGSIDGDSPAAQRYCIPSGTPIILENGTSKNVELLQVGDMVITHRGVSRPIEGVFPQEHEELIRVELNTGFVIYASPNHPLLVFREGEWKWVRCEFLTDIDYLAQLVSEGDGLTEADNINPALLTAELDSCSALGDKFS